jgi:hypothetical protein
MRIWTRRLYTALVSTSLCGVLVACGGSEAPEHESTDESAGSAPETTAQRLSEPAEHWLVAGDESRGEVIDREGQPEVTTGRYVNQGKGIDFGSMGTQEWLVASREGSVQLVDNNGVRAGSARSVFDGEGTLEFVGRGNGNWLAGGSAGIVQRLDRNGQPTQDTYKPLGDETLTAGAHGNSKWLVGSKQGGFRHLSESSLDPESAPLSHSSGEPVVAVLRTEANWYGFTTTHKVELTTNQIAGSTSIADGRKITAAAHHDGTIVVGSDDGHVLVGGPNELDGASWQEALDGAAVRAIAWKDSEWLVVGDNGKARRLAADGTPEGSVEVLADGQDLSAVRPHPNGWMVGVSELSVVHRVGPQLEPPAEPTNLLDGEPVNALAAGGPGYLAVGDGGSYRLLDTEASPSSEVQTIDGVESLTAAAWNGERFIAGAAAGQIFVLDDQGTVVETREDVADTEITSISWSGDSWVAALADGRLQRLHDDGRAFRNTKTTPLDTIRAAEYNGDGWMVVGAQDDQGAYAILDSELQVPDEVKTVQTISGTFQSIGWNGNEWLAGGPGGYVVRIDQTGSVVERESGNGIRNVLNGGTVRAINFNAGGNQYLVGGDHGAIRRLAFNAEPIRNAIVVNGFQTIRAVQWAAPRGYPGSTCLSSEVCLAGSCIDKGSETLCCESACEGTCESCLQETTGEPDGICAPVPKGEEPPARNGSCAEQSPETCGTTGVCDGQGSCQTHGSDVECRAASCQDAELTPAGQCAEMGQTCMEPESTSCEPYTCADGAAECRDSCESDDHCVEGFVCQEGSCVEESNEDDGEEQSEDDDSGNGGGGGCSVPGEGSAPVGFTHLLVGLLAGAALVRRRIFS